jgi:two-component system, LytTR family, sensor kinase
MRNPIFKNRTSIQVYMLVWLLVMLANVVNLVLVEKLDLISSVTDTVVSDALFAGMSIGLWYPIRFLNFDNHSVFTFALKHIGIALAFLTAWVVASNMFAEILVDSIDYQQQIAQSVPWKILGAVMMYCLVVLGFYVHIYYSSFKETKLAEAELKTMVREAELNMLKSQLNPHFIFNSLNSISSLTVSDPQCAQDMVVKLSSYIRYALKNKDNNLVNLAEELENAKLYLEIEKVRFGDKLSFTVSLGEGTEQASVPSMMLQPLLENAVKHGIYESLSPVYIALHCRLEQTTLVIQIKNNYEADGRSKPGSGIGLKNVKERLRLLYGEKGRMNIEDQQDSFTVNLSLPQNEIV